MKPAPGTASIADPAQQAVTQVETPLGNETEKDTMPSTVSVLLCTYRRPADLARCLEALSRQTRLPDEVVVVHRDIDAETRALLAGPLPANLNIRIAEVQPPGLIAARNTGLDVCRGDILALIDDDAVPYPWWCERLLEHFQANPQLGGLGGRDRCFNGKEFDDRQVELVGKLQWIGRRIGNHHIGTGGLREVDMLKGANMSYRAAAVKGLRFDTRLRGSGSQPYEDIAFSLAVRRAGWQLMYDPDVLVDHYEGAREEIRYYTATIPVADAEGFRNFAYNGVVAMWDEFSPIRRVAFLTWSFFLGTRVCPGLVQAVRFTPIMGLASWKRFWIAQEGLFGAARDFLLGRVKARA
jgi:GT2 family glycosyltransferase